MVNMSALLKLVDRFNANLTVILTSLYFVILSHQFSILHETMQISNGIMKMNMLKFLYYHISRQYKEVAIRTV